MLAITIFTVGAGAFARSTFFVFDSVILQSRLSFAALECDDFSVAACFVASFTFVFALPSDPDAPCVKPTLRRQARYMICPHNSQLCKPDISTSGFLFILS